uniref:Uncharacterized protein n=1 Tax=Rhizophora mucronata TaxID=61149 RepID=A0A2P2R2H8_RHIMU
MKLNEAKITLYHRCYISSYMPPSAINFVHPCIIRSQ